MPKKRRTTRKSPSVAAVAGRVSAARRSSTSTTRIRKIKRYGWIPDIPDQRDYLYAAPPAFLRALPARIDLRKQRPPVYDQGQLGSCTANAIGGALGVTVIFGVLVFGAAYMFIRSRRTPITPENVNAEWEGGLVPADEREPAKTAS